MRVLVATWHNRIIGGAEAYLNLIVPALATAGIELGFCHEIGGDHERSPINLPSRVPTWCITELGRDKAIAEIAQWKPTIVYSQGQSDHLLERALTDLAPSILFAHGYHGTCVSGTKLVTFPTPTPCERTFGPGCLINYFPRRCGGLNPATMVRLYSDQSNRFQTLHRYQRILTASDHMRREYLRHGFPLETVEKVPYPILLQPPADASRARSSDDPTFRILFVGRLQSNKGGELLLRALPTLRKKIGMSVLLTFAGDGMERARWERLAGSIEGRDANIRVRFLGWTDKERLSDLYAGHDVLAVPSIWPEPFGLVGLEGGTFGLPVAAFDVGGVPDWLVSGENGFLAPGNPPTVEGLATALLQCREMAVRRPNAAGEAARRILRGFTLEGHIEKLLSIFQSLA